jgi:hypothetical protein
MATVTPLGFAPEAILDLVAKPFAGPLAWVGDGTTALTVGYEPDGTAWYVSSEVVSGSGDTEPAIQPICDDRVEVGVTVTFSTSDGAFAESWAPLRLAATSAEAASWGVTLDLHALGGSFDMAPFVERDDYDQLRAWVDGTITGVGASIGRVGGQASGTSECDPGEPCTSWAENVDVATWGDSASE